MVSDWHEHVREPGDDREDRVMTNDGLRCKGAWGLGNNCGTCQHCVATARDGVETIRELRGEQNKLLAMLNEVARLIGGDKLMVTDETLTREVRQLVERAEAANVVYCVEFQGQPEAHFRTEERARDYLVGLAVGRDEWKYRVVKVTVQG